jgi:hypothetical protein
MTIMLLKIINLLLIMDEVMKKYDWNDKVSVKA